MVRSSCNSSQMHDTKVIAKVIRMSERVLIKVVHLIIDIVFTKFTELIVEWAVQYIVGDRPIRSR